VRPATARPVRVFSDIGELQEVGEGANDAVHIAMRKAVEESVQLSPIIRAPLARKADRRLPHRLDQLKERVPFLLTQRITQDAPQQADIIAERTILLQPAARRIL
jgi:hypothetical protein